MVTPAGSPPLPAHRDAGGRAGAWALVLLLVAAAALRAPGLDAGLWYDEIETLVEYVRQPLGEILTTFNSKNQHLLYSVLGHLSVSAFGESAAALRLPAVVLGVLSLAAFHRFASSAGSRDEAWLGTAALAASYHHVWFSQNARGYTGLLLFTLLATRMFRRVLDARAPDWRDALWYGLWMALAVYTHFTAALVGVAHALVAGGVAVARRRSGGPGAWPALAALVAAVGLGLLFYLPVLSQIPGTLLGQSPFAASTTWQSPLWLLAETARGLGRGLPGGWATVAAGVVVVGMGLVRFWRQDRILTALMIVPGLVTAATVLALGHNLWPRFFFFSAGFAVLFAVRGGFELASLVLGARGRRAARLAGAVAVAGSAVTVPRAWGPKQDYAGAAAFVEQHRRPGDAVAVVDMTAYPYLTYQRRDWTAVTSAAGLEALERSHPRTFLLYTFPIRLAVVQPGVWERLRAAYDTAAVFPGTVGDGAVVVMLSGGNPQASRGSQ